MKAQITNRVGTGSSANLAHDVSLIQAMLKVIKNKAGQPYFALHYDGLCTGHTIAAIKAFQTANQTAANPVEAPPPRQGAMGIPALRSPNPAFGTLRLGAPSLTLASGGVAVAPARPALGVRAPSLALLDDLGSIRPSGPTMSKLNELLPASHKGIRTAPGTHLVYWAGSKADAVRSAAAVRNHSELKEELIGPLGDLVDQMYDKYEIVMDVLPNSAPLRTFAKQYEAKSNNHSDAGPGESNHNFGGAMDIAYYRLQWMHPHGQTMTEQGIDLGTLSKVNDRWKMEMFQLRNAIACDQLNLFPTIKKDDQEHLQIFDDHHVSMGRSLAKLLSNTGARMRWEVIMYPHPPGQPHRSNDYTCDLGFGGTLHNVGDAMRIWERRAPIQKAWIAAGKHVPVTAVSDANVVAVRNALRAAFETAEAAKDQWTAEP
jgi:hypothetical protein